jgi:DNA-binding PucR family transcriptional regulator
MVSHLLRTIDEEHAWYRTLSTKNRSWVGLVAQASIDSFVAWCKDKNSSAATSQEIFAVAPAELTRAVSLHQTLELVKSGVAVIEQEAEVISAPGRAHELQEAILRYSREFAFATAEVYARAAEIRGSWDARLEALVMDSLLRGESGPAVRSLVAALGWSDDGPATCLVIGATGPLSQAKVRDIRHAARAAVPQSLAGFHSDRVILLLAGQSDFTEVIKRLMPSLGDGPVITGPVVGSLAGLPRSIRAANAALEAISAWPGAPRPVAADDLLPERLLIGDPEARDRLLATVYEPLLRVGKDAVATVSAFLELGRSLEASARQLFVHPNTVRYRLAKITETCGWDPGNPREAYVLQHGLALGRLREAQDSRSDQ